MRQRHFAGTNFKPRKLLENAHAVPAGGTLRSHHHGPDALRGLGAPPENENILFPQRNRGATGVYCELAGQQAPLRAKQWRHVLITVPWCTLVSGPDDPSTGGAVSDPDYAKRLLPLSDRVCPRQRRKAQWRRFENGRDAFFELTMQRISACK